ncbi:MAG: hypothetical protein KGK07_10580 [Chloroflexota bacterium]|nr:hypothetical protein [Chloroflexota bacterium]
MIIILSAPPAIVPALFVAAFVLGTAWSFDLVRRAIATRPRVAAPSDGAVHAADDARAALAALSLDDDPAAVYARLATILQAYLDARFGLRTASMAGADVERAIGRAGYARAAGRQTAHLLARCAEMQAASVRPTKERIAADVQGAREIIDLLA